MQITPTMRYNYISVRMTKTKQNKTKQKTVTTQLKYIAIIRPSICTSEYLYGIHENLC